MLKSLVKSKYFPLIIFSFFYLCFSFSTYKVWPIANGEEFRYLRGKETLEHLLHGEFTELLVQPRPHYFLYNGYVSLLAFLNPNFYYEWFHLLNLLFSLSIFVFVYLIALRLYEDPRWATVSLISLVLFPTFFGQMAINPIDMPFTAFYLASLLAILHFGKGRLKNYQILLLGLLFGVTQGLRQLGLSLYILLFLFQLPKEKNLVSLLKKRFFEYFLIFVVANFFMVITWPNFAVNYFKSFAWYLSIGQNFYLWDFGLLFGGKMLSNPERPWYYLPWLQFLTTPIFVLLPFAVVFGYLKKLLKNETFKFLSITLVVNYLLYFVLNPVLYDGTRHFLYLLPILVLISFAGLKYFLEKSKAYWKKIVALGIILVNVLIVARYTYDKFPYHYVYFNEISNLFGNPYHLYESDYSSTLYKSAAEWIRDEYLEEVSNENLRVYACDNGYAVDYYSHKKFLVALDTEESDLIICDYRTIKGFKGGRNVTEEIIWQKGYSDTPIIYIFEK